MAEETRPPEPPKIKLGLGGISGKPISAGGLPPKIKIQSAEKKSETARIDISKAQPPPAVMPGDIKEVPKEDLSEFYKKSTIRIEAVQQPAAETQRLEAAKKSTMRVDARPAGDTQKVKGDTHSLAPDTAKKSTLRVDGAKPSDTQTVKQETHRIQEAAKKATMRVDSGIEQKKKSETAKLEIPPAELSKHSTARISLGTEAANGDGEDIFKKRTMPVSVPTTPPPASAKPPTISVPRPKTYQMRQPSTPTASEPASLSPAPPSAVSEAKKSETARLDLPPETGEDRPATRPKTIRIRRPDGSSGRKALTIARPMEEAVFTPEAAAEIGLAVGAEEQPGAIWAVTALAAVLVAAVLIYVLAAQTFAPNLPWPGKIL